MSPKPTKNEGIKEADKVVGNVRANSFPGHRKSKFHND